MTAEQSEAVSGTSASKWRSQEIAREQSRRRRPNIGDGEGQRVVKVRLTDAEYATVAAAASESGMTVPWYLAQCALNPVSSSAKPGKRSAPWLPWPKRLALQGLLLSATSALHEIRVQHVAKVGSNINQIARVVNGTGYLDPEQGEELGVALEEWHELSEELRERSERMEQLAKDVTRR